jgi:2-iminobutanoate/2-iminopropanoate deaminase
LSQAVVADGKFVFLSGQIGKHPVTGAVPEDFLGQARQALENLRAVLKVAGAELNDVVRVLVFVTDSTHGQAFNSLYRQYFGDEFPTRTRVQVAALSPGLQIEIEAIAVLPS